MGLLLRLGSWARGVVPVAVILVVVIVLFRKVLFTPGMIYWGDFNFPIFPDAYLRILYPLWNSMWSFSSLLMLGRLPYVLLPFAAGYLLGSAQVLPKLVLVLPIVIAWGSMFSLLRYMFERNDLLRTSRGADFLLLLLASVYSLNFWTMNMMDDYPSLAAYAFLPLVVENFARVCTGGTDFRRRLLIFGILVSFLIAGVDYIAIFGIIAVAYLVAFPFTSHGLSRAQLKRIALAMLVVLGVTSFWSLPFVASAALGAGHAALVERTNTFDEILQQNLYNSFLNTIRLRGFENPHYQFGAMYYPALASSISNYLGYALAAFAGLGIMMRKSRSTLFFGLLFVIFLLLSVGPNSPSDMQFYYDIVFRTGPFGIPYRAGNVWAGGLAFAMVPLASIGVVELARRRVGHGGVHKVLILLVLFLVLSNSLQTYPEFAGHVDHYFTPTMVPESYYIANNLLANTGNNYKVLWLPEHYEGLPTTWNAKPTGPLELYSTTKPSYNMYQDYVARNFYYFILYDLLLGGQTTNLGRLLQPMDVGYVAQMKDTSQVSSAALQNSISDQKGFSQIMNSTNVSMYSYSNMTTAIFASNDPIVYVGSLRNFATLINTPTKIVADDLTLVAQDQTIGAVLKQNLVDYSLVLGGNSRSLEGDLEFLMGNNTVTLAPYSHSLYLSSDHWAKTSTSWPDWSSHLTSSENNRETDFGLGLVYTESAGQTLTMTFDIPRTSYYDMGVRFMTGQKLGNFTVEVDGAKTLQISSGQSSSYNSFEWKTLDNLYLTKGEHSLTLTSVTGGDLVNLISIASQEQAQESKSLAARALAGENVAYVFDANETRVVSDPSAVGYFSPDVLHGGSFNVWVSGSNLNDSVLSAGGQHFLQSADMRASGDQWAEFQDVKLLEGQNTLQFLNSTSSLFESLVIVPQGFRVDNTAVVDMMNSTSPYSYHISVSSPSPFVTMIPELYDPLWFATSGGETSTPIRAFDILNGFVIDKSGNVDISVLYALQPYGELGIALTLATVAILGCAAGLEWQSIRRDRRLRDLRP